VAQPNVPLTLYLGGVPVPVIYQGRSGCCVGEDQIVFTVPNNVPTGCAVPLVIQVGTGANTISNSTAMPVAAGSRNCTPNSAALAAGNLSQITAGTPIVVGDIDMEKGFNDKGGTVDQASYRFIKFASKPGLEPFFGSFLDYLPVGTCAAYGVLNPDNNPPTTAATLVDGGASLSIKGPNGAVNLPANSGELTTINAAGTFLGAGTFTVTGTGGKDVGPFSATITVPVLPTLTNPALPVTRANGLTVTWKGGDATGNVSLVLSSALDNTFTQGGSAQCNVAASAGTFTIPPYILLALPTGNFANLLFGGSEISVPFTATGLAFGTLHVQTLNTLVGFQLR
jgi:hypothetical protein